MTMRRCPGSLIAFILLAVSTQSSAHVGTIVYPIYELPTSDLPDLHDGTLADWDEVLPQASLDQNYFVNAGRGLDLESLAFRVFLAWHHVSGRIFVAVERFDDIYLPPGPDDYGEGFTQFEIDADHSGGQYWFFQDDVTSAAEALRYSGAQAQTYTIRPEAPDGDLIAMSSYEGWPQSPPYTDVGGFQSGDSPNLSSVELALTPWDDLNPAGPDVSRRSILAPGRIIGFQILVLDLDDPPIADGEYRLAEPAFWGTTSSGGMHAAFSENFVDGELVPCDRGDCSGATTAVSRDSWGRIKAAFR